MMLLLLCLGRLDVKRFPKCDFRDECIVKRTMYSHFENKPEFLNSGDSIRYIIYFRNHDEEYQGEFLEEFDMTAMIKALKRNLYILDCFENNIPDVTEAYYREDFTASMIKAQEAKPFSVRRFSNRKGEIMHIGKNTSFGFRGYRVK